MRFGSVILGLMLFVATAVARPNIVLINCDDFDFDESELWDFYDYREHPSYTGAAMLGYTNDWKNGLSYKLPMLTPHIRSLAEEGCVFDRFYMTSSMCTPSRYSLMTGQYASRSPMLEREFGKTVPAGFQQESDLAPKQWIFPKAMQAVGYATGLVGKWHLNAPGSEERGFIEPSLAGKNARDPKIAARIQEVYDKGVNYVRDNFGFDYVGAIYQHNANGLGLPKELVGSEHHLEWQTYHALQFLDRHHDHPFFLYFAPSVPHGWFGGDLMGAPVEATLRGYSNEHIAAQASREEVVRRLKERGVDMRNAGATWLDDSVGAVLQKLKQYGLEENTLVIFTSDHQSRGKFSVTEGCRVPFVARWPGKIPARSRCGQLMANIDMTPTLLSLVGGKAPEGIVIDGLDMSRFFQGASGPLTERDLLLEIGYMRAVVSGDWKYCALRFPPDRPVERSVAVWRQAREIMRAKGITPPPKDAPITDEEMKYVSYDGRIYYDRFTGEPELSQGPNRTFPHYTERDQLYDLDADPYEQMNLFSNPEHAVKLKEMQKRLSNELSKLPRQFGEFH